MHQSYLLYLVCAVHCTACCRYAKHCFLYSVSSNHTYHDQGLKTALTLQATRSFQVLLPPLIVLLLLQALSTLERATFQAQLGRFFPVLTALMACEHAPADVQRALSELFLTRVGPLLPALAQQQL